MIWNKYEKINGMKIKIGSPSDYFLTFFFLSFLSFQHIHKKKFYSKLVFIRLSVCASDVLSVLLCVFVYVYVLLYICVYVSVLLYMCVCVSVLLYMCMCENKPISCYKVGTHFIIIFVRTVSGAARTATIKARILSPIIEK